MIPVSATTFAPTTEKALKVMVSKLRNDTNCLPSNRRGR
jgi:hypothetical protein